MLPLISEFSNQQFYHGSIRDSASRQRDQEGRKSAVTFINHSGQESRVGQSIANEEEASIIMKLVFHQHVELEQPLEDIGVITGYAAQADLLNRRARELFGERSAALEIHTVDGFQGRDKKSIILSTVRSNSGCYIGFMTDERRLNVALTRAEDRLFVVGNANTLGYANPWNNEVHIFARYMQWLQKVGAHAAAFYSKEARS